MKQTVIIRSAIGSVFGAIQVNFCFSAKFTSRRIIRNLHKLKFYAFNSFSKIIRINLLNAHRAVIAITDSTADRVVTNSRARILFAVSMKYCGIEISRGIVRNWIGYRYTVPNFASNTVWHIGCQDTRFTIVIKATIIHDDIIFVRADNCIGTRQSIISWIVRVEIGRTKRGCRDIDVIRNPISNGQHRSRLARFVRFTIIQKSIVSRIDQDRIRDFICRIKVLDSKVTFINLSA